METIIARASIVLVLTIWNVIVSSLVYLIFRNIHFFYYLSDWKCVKRGLKKIRTVREELEASPDYFNDNKHLDKYITVCTYCDSLRQRCKKYHFPVPVELIEAESIINEIDESLSDIARTA